MNWDRMKCRFRDCERDALMGWTTCARHRSAGTSRVHFERMKREREARARRLQRDRDEREAREVREAEERVRRMKADG